MAIKQYAAPHTSPPPNPNKSFAIAVAGLAALSIATSATRQQIEASASKKASAQAPAQLSDLALLSDLRTENEVASRKLQNYAARLRTAKTNPAQPTVGFREPASNSGSNSQTSVTPSEDVSTGSNTGSK